MQSPFRISAALFNEIVAKELALAGIKAMKVAYDERKEHPVPADLIGALRFDDGTVTVFIRQQFYWDVKSSRPLPRKAAQALYDRSEKDVFGDFFGGCDVIVGDKGSDFFRANTQEGLIAIVAAMKRNFGQFSESAATIYEIARWGDHDIRSIISS